MRNLFLSLACMLFATSVWAQTETAVPQPQEKKKSIAGFETNGFWDNWEISASAGAGSAFISRNNAGSYGDRILRNQVDSSRFRRPSGSSGR